MPIPNRLLNFKTVRASEKTRWLFYYGNTIFETPKSIDLTKGGDRIELPISDIN